MMLKDLAGQKFGRLTALYRDEEKLKPTRWVCQCECGNVVIVNSSNLIRGHTKSCGCLQPGIVGRKVGQLVICENLGNDRYLCKCLICGGEEIRGYKSLTNPNKNAKCKNCGCEERKQKLKESDTFVEGTQPARIQPNRPLSKVNSSGVTGVNWDKSRGKWQASLRFKGRKYNLGRFDKIEDAIAARKTAEKEIFGNFLTWYESYKATREDKDNKEGANGE